MTKNILPDGINKGDTLLCHVSFKYMKRTFGVSDPSELINELWNAVGSSGNIIFPAFTYCFQREDNQNGIFSRRNSQSVNGYISEFFRLQPEVVRTGSPTHSFCISGTLTTSLPAEVDNPDSPLGNESLMGLLCNLPEAKILLIGTDFTSLSILHYFEVFYKLPYVNCNPFEPFGYKSIGISETGKFPLREIPGCSNGFNAFQEFLAAGGIIPDEKLLHSALRADLLKRLAEEFLSVNPYGLLCKRGECMYCDVRHGV